MRLEVRRVGSRLFSTMRARHSLAMGDVAGRGHFAGGADDQEQVAVLGQFLGIGLGRRGNGLAEKDHVGPDEAAAEAIERGDGKSPGFPGDGGRGKYRR